MDRYEFASDRNMIHQKLQWTSDTIQRGYIFRDAIDIFNSFCQRIIFAILRGPNLQAFHEKFQNKLNFQQHCCS